MQAPTTEHSYSNATIGNLQPVREVHVLQIRATFAQGGKTLLTLNEQQIHMFKKHL